MVRKRYLRFVLNTLYCDWSSFFTFYLKNRVVQKITFDIKEVSK